MATSARAQAMLAMIEGLWSNFDELFEAIERDARWNEAHGADWTFRDVPYHMMYFDRELVAEALERGTNVPVGEQRTQRSVRELNEWNARMFALRPAGETPRQSLSRWRAVRERIRKRANDLDEKRLENPVWIPLVGCGWLPASVALGACIAHTWSEFVQLRYLAGVTGIEPSPEATHAAMGFLLQFLPSAFDASAAVDTRFTIVMSYTGPGGGDWTIRVSSGQATLEEGGTAAADLVIRQSPVTAELIRQGKIDLGAAMQSGEVQVEGMEHLETFGRLFPHTGLDTQIEPVSPGARD